MINRSTKGYYIEVQVKGTDRTVTMVNIPVNAETRDEAERLVRKVYKNLLQEGSVG